MMKVRLMMMLVMMHQKMLECVNSVLCLSYHSVQRYPDVGEHFCCTQRKDSTASCAQISPIDGAGNEEIPLYDMKKTEVQQCDAIALSIASVFLCVMEFPWKHVIDEHEAKIIKCFTVLLHHFYQILVDTAMLAAVSGMASLLFTLIKLDSYLYYIMPFPLVLSSLRCDVTLFTDVYFELT